MKSLFFLLLIIPQLALADVIFEKLNVTDSQGREIVSLRIEGDIEESDYMDFSEAISEINQNNYRVQFDSVVLNSRGGAIYSAIRIGTMIRGNHLSTLIQPNDNCISACALILQAGVCKIAEGDVGLHRSATDVEFELDQLPAIKQRERKNLDQYLTAMGAHPQILWYVKNTPHWSVKFLSEIEKQDFGYYNATPEEMDYRLEIASQKLGQFKQDLLDTLTEKLVYGNSTENENQYHPIRFPSCTEQLFLEESVEHVGVNIEPKAEDIFEIYESDQGIEVDGHFKSTTVIPYKDEQPYYFSFSYFAKGKEVEYKERVTVSGPTVWGDAETGEEFGKDNPDIVISDDKRSVTMTRRVTNTGYSFGAWVLTKEDPKGPLEITILFKDKVIRKFDFIVE